MTKLYVTKLCVTKMCDNLYVTKFDAEEEEEEEAEGHPGGGVDLKTRTAHNFVGKYIRWNGKGQIECQIACQNTCR